MSPEDVRRITFEAAKESNASGHYSEAVKLFDLAEVLTPLSVHDAGFMLAHHPRHYPLDPSLCLFVCVCVGL